VNDLLADLNEPQRLAVTHGEGPLLIVAGPGSGKTRVVSRRVAWLLRSGVGPGEVLAVTFTNKAAGELRERVQALNPGVGLPPGGRQVPGGPPAAGLWVSTFHSACARILRENSEAAGLPSSFSIYDEEDRRRLAGRVIRELGLPPERMKPASLVKRVSAWKGAGIGPEDAAKDVHVEHQSDLAKAYAHYERLLREAGALDFDDLLLRTHRLLGSSAEVLGRYASRFRHVLVDEYQDTNRLQFLLARSLASGTRNLCATGDPDQSIYGWRGADLRNILDFEEHYPDATIVRLEDNYRSTENVLRAAGALIRRNASRHEKDLRGGGVSGPEVRVEIFAGADEEGEGIGAAVAKHIEGGAAASEVAVLYRVNSRSRAVERALRVRGIPYQIVRGVEFYQRAEVKDLVAWLRLLANPRDAEAFARVLEAPRRGAGPVARGKVLDEASRRGVPVRDALFLGSGVLGVAGKAGKALDGAADALRRLMEIPLDEAGPLLGRVVLETGYREWLEENWPEDHQERWDNVAELIEAARAYDGRAGGRGLPGFLEEASLVSDQDRWDEDAPKVTLMTLHASKGLEFPAVFIAGVEEGVLPHARSTKDRAGFEDAAGIEEERRLLFVGMTRAKRRLWLSAALRPQGWTGGGGGPSRFLGEIGREGVARVEHAVPSPARDEHSGGSFPARPGARGPWGRPAAPEGVDPDPGCDLDLDAASPGAAFRVGQRVRHAKFGSGRVRGLERHGPVVYATVEFLRGGLKKLDLEKARLESMGDGP
jgi:DNA helicase-2/ATP-dependent DNA helicase PcrA